MCGDIDIDVLEKRNEYKGNQKMKNSEKSNTITDGMLR